MTPAPLDPPRRVRPRRVPEGVTGPWTSHAVQVLIGLGAAHRQVKDRGDTYPAWEWDYRAPEFRLHVLGYLEVHDGRWRYVLELTDTPTTEKHGLLLLPTLTLAGDETLMHHEAAAMLNYALTLPVVEPSR